MVFILHIAVIMQTSLCINKKLFINSIILDSVEER